MSKLERRDLINYAFVSQGIFGSSDLLSAMLPLIQPTVAGMEGQIFDPNVLAAKISEKFPWKMRSDAAELLAPRMEQLGWLDTVVDHDGKRAYRYKEISGAPLDQSSEERIEGRLQAIGESFRQFVEHISPLEAAAYESIELQELLLRWLVDAGGFDRSSIMSAAGLSKGAPGDHDVGQKDRKSDSKKPRFQQQDDYLCARFIQYLANTDPEKLEDIVSISAVTLIAEVVLEYKEPRVEDLNVSLDVYYDGPFLMDLLGLTGDERQDNARYIHDNLLSVGAKARVLDHSCDEIRDNLSAMLSMPLAQRHGPTWDAIRKALIQETFVREVNHNVEGYVENLDIPIIKTQMQLLPKDERYFPPEMAGDLEARLPWENRTAAERDALSATFVIRKRVGEAHTNVFQSKAIVLSRNEAFAGIVRRFCMHERIIRANQIPPVLHQRTFSGLLFLTLGSTEQQEITRRDLLSNCDDVVRCRPDIIEKMRNTLAELDPEKAERFDALISKPRSTQILMDLTLGANEIITSKADELYEQIQLASAEKVTQRKDAEISRIRQRHKDREKKLKDEITKQLDEKTAIQTKFSESEEQQLQIVQGWVNSAMEKWRREMGYQKFALIILVIGSFICTLLFAIRSISVLSSVALAVAAAAIPAILLIAQILGRFPNLLEGVLRRRRERLFLQRVSEAQFVQVMQKFEIDWDNGIVQHASDPHDTDLITDK